MIMNLNIEVINSIPQMIYGIPSLEGEITIGNFKESFHMPLDCWAMNDYQRQWREGLERIKTHNQSCLVANVQGLPLTPYINWWILYKDKRENKLFVQNHILVEEIYTSQVGNKSFTIENCYNYIQPREIIDEEGNKISEWSIDLA